MLKRAILVQLLLLVGYFSVNSQPKPDTYQPVKSTGLIPADMLIKSSQKYEVEKSTISKEESKKDRKSIESFYLSTNFEIDKLLLSGLVSFNDPITQYLNKIVDVLLKNEPELRKRVRVYTMKSPVMNAFATNQGIIFVNLGLLARVKSEAELAFVLSHEIIHVEEKHSLNKYLKVQTIQRDKDLYKGLSLDDKLANVNHYSRELETEADEKGLKRYLDAGYSIDAIEASFTALSYSHTPFTDHEFDYKWLESNTFSFPQEFYRDKITTPRPLDDGDTTSTHPSIQQRKTSILTKIGDFNKEGRKNYLVSESEFNSVREFSQFEVCRMHLARQRYDLAIYEAQALLKTYPDNLYLQKVTLKALAAKAYLIYDGIYVSEWEDYINNDLQGNAQRCYHLNLCLALKDEYMAAVATRYAWQLKQANPQDQEIGQLADSLMHLLFYKMEVSPSYFSMTPRTASELNPILLAYDKINNPDKYRKLDSLAILDLIINDTDKIVNTDTNMVSITTKGVGGIAPISASGNDDNLEDEDTEEDGWITDQVELEPEDTFYVSTVEDAKKLKIRLTGYQKYMLKHKDKFDILGVRKDGTFVYKSTDVEDGIWANGDNGRNDGNTSARSNNDRDANRDANGRDNEQDINGDEDDDEEELYIHDFTLPIDTNFHKYAFVDFADDPSFLKQANKYHKLKDKDKDIELSKGNRKKKIRENELNSNRGFALDIDKVVIVNPRYNKLNLAKPDKQEYLTSEKNQKHFSDLLELNAKASGIKFQLIDNNDLKNKDVNTFNDIAYLNEWLDERLELGSTIPFSTLELSEREALVKKYGTRYFMWTGNLNIRERDYMRSIIIAYSCIFPPMLPFVLPRLIRSGKYQIYYYLVFDLMNNEMVIGDVVTSNQFERDDFLNSQIYYTFNQLKYKR